MGVPEGLLGVYQQGPFHRGVQLVYVRQGAVEGDVHGRAQLPGILVGIVR